MKRAIACLVVIVFLVAGCGDDATEPEQTPTDNVHHYTRKDLHPEGQVVETANGFTVIGSLDVDNGTHRTSFRNAALDVQFDSEGRLASVSGSAEIPAPSENVSFANPIQADVGFFTGRFLNENRELPILLKQKIEYFVFYAALALETRIRDDDSPAETAITVKAPVGGRVLMLADYTDPMYFVYGEQDLAGAFGHGESWHGRLPYVPTRPAQKIYSFDAKSIRVGKFAVKQIFGIEGSILEGTHAGIDLMLDPIEANLEAGYVYGVNGRMDIELDVKQVVQLNVPIAVGSAALRAEVNTSTGAFAGAFIDGLAEPAGWWPEFIPVRPVASLLVQGNLETTGAFDLHLHGEYGIGVQEDAYKLVGDFHATPEALTVTGDVVTGDTTYRLSGQIDASKTTISAVPPRQLLDRIRGAVNAELEESIAEAEAAWENLQEATANYEFELSLRGLRSGLPYVIDAVKTELARNIATYVDQHKGTVYYNSLRSFMASADDKYYDALDDLRAQTLATHDSDAWRAAIARALRTAAGYKTFDETYRYVVLGQTLATVRIQVPILSDNQVASLLQAADNVRYIKETWDVKVRAQEIYDRIPRREIFERVRDDIQNGVVMIPSITAIGYAQPHGSADLAVFADISGTRHEIASANLFDLAEMSAAIAAKVVSILVSG